MPSLHPPTPKKALRKEKWVKVVCEADDSEACRCAIKWEQRLSMGPGGLKSHFLVKSHPEGQRPGDRNRGKDCDRGGWAGAEPAAHWPGSQGLFCVGVLASFRKIRFYVQNCPAGCQIPLHWVGELALLRWLDESESPACLSRLRAALCGSPVRDEVGLWLRLLAVSCSYRLVKNRRVFISSKPSGEEQILSCTTSHNNPFCPHFRNALLFQQQHISSSFVTNELF